MSELNSINGGYKGGSPRVRSENSRKIISQDPKPIDILDLINRIKTWYVGGSLTTSELHTIITQLQEFCNLEVINKTNSIPDLESKITDLNEKIRLSEEKLNELDANKDLVVKMEMLKNLINK
jgi:hypothetical protein|tara:strand:+ start:140 stop:508 length:369 start_codon:yes stop_codon:yes gene_type:complete